MTLSDVCARHFASYHRQNRAAVKALLDKESWKGVHSDTKGIGLPTLDGLMLVISERQVTRKRRTYEEWLAEGNPFADGGAKIATAEGILQKATGLNQDTSLRTFCGSSIKIMKLLGTYVVLIDSFRDPKLAAAVVEGVAQLFQFYIFWCFRLFGEVRALPVRLASSEIFLDSPRAPLHNAPRLCTQLRWPFSRTPFQKHCQNFGTDNLS